MQTFLNNVAVVSAEALTDVATSLELLPGEGAKLGSPTVDDPVRVTAAVGYQTDESDWEIMLVTDVTSDTLTLVRAQEGTSGLIWPGGTVLEVRNTAESMDDLVAINPGLNIVSVPGGGTYNFVLTDAFSLLEVALAPDMEIPLDATLNFPVDTKMDIVAIGVTQPTITVEGGVTLNQAGAGQIIDGQWRRVTIEKTAANTWELTGQFTT